jgi:hypothetical protein
MKSAPELRVSGSAELSEAQAMYKPDSTHECKPSAMSSHDFEDECARMRDGSGMDVVYSLADSMQRSWRADCKIGQ